MDVAWQLPPNLKEEIQYCEAFKSYTQLYFFFILWSKLGD